jgi:hypothetical protein
MDNWHRSSCRGKSFVDAMLALEILQAYFAAVQVTLFHDLEIHDLTPLGRLLTQDLFEVGLINMVPLTWISPTPSLTGHHCLLGCNVRTRNYSICSPLKAASVAGRAIFDEGLAPRNGSYPQYHSGDIRTLVPPALARRTRISFCQLAQVSGLSSACPRCRSAATGTWCERSILQA